MFNYFSLVQNHAIYSKTDITLREVPQKNLFLFFNFEKKYGNRFSTKNLFWILMQFIKI